MIQASAVVLGVQAQALVPALVVALAATAVTIGSTRLLFWWSWARDAALVIVLVDFVLCFVVCGVSAYAASRGGWQPTSSDFVNGAIPAAVGSSAVRRSPRSKQSTADVSTFGLVRFGHGFVDEVVGGRIQAWAQDLSDEALLEACARLDAARSGAASSLRVRSAWRNERAYDLKDADEHVRREARAALENALTTGIRRAMWRRPA